MVRAEPTWRRESSDRVVRPPERQPLGPNAILGLVRARKALAFLAIGAIGASAINGASSNADRLAGLAVTAIVVATLIGLAEASKFFVPRRFMASDAKAPKRPGALAVLVVTSLAASMAQAWFRSGTVIAGGDITPPGGIAWITRLFEGWTWSGSNLGGPSTLELQLPWAMVLGSIRLLGGSAELAQRLWDTALFAGGAAAVMILLVALGIRPIAAGLGALAYVLCPYVAVYVVPNTVYMAAMIMLPLVPASVILAATGNLPRRAAIALIALTAPLLGYIYQNPPLVGLILLGAIGTPFVAGWLYGASAGRRAGKVAAMSIIGCAVVSAYWIIPAALQLTGVAQSELASIASWSWTEARATLNNALWLNTHWGWTFAEYFPYAHLYDHLPLSVLKYCPAMLSFAALGLEDGLGAIVTEHELRRLRLVVIAISAGLFAIVFSTGTNPPGNVIFDRLYSLPLGWLLREPGRFLMAADLAFAVLIGVVVEHLLGMRLGRRTYRRRRDIRRSAFAIVPIVTLLIIAPGFPLVTGAIIPDARPVLPPSHVTVPSYWAEMTTYIDRLPAPGAVLVLPQNDFYQMPYRWGYYGNDGFIIEMLRRPVLVPSPGGYVPASEQLRATIGLIEQSIITGDSQRVRALLRLLGAPLILLRGDVMPTFPGRTYLSPKSLAAGLQTSSTLDLIHSAGPLLLFRVRDATAENFGLAPFFATVNTPTPDLRLLSFLPDGAALVSASPQSGVPSVQELPPVAEWLLKDGSLTLDVAEPAGWSFNLVRLDSNEHGVTGQGPPSGSQSDDVTVRRVGGTDRLAVSVPVKVVFDDRTAVDGQWGPAGDCANFGGTGAQRALSAEVHTQGGPDGGRFLRLSAREDSACEVRDLRWRSGPILITMNVRHLSGAPPRLCLWEIGPERCTSVPVAGVRDGWTTFSGTAIPDIGTTGLRLYLYSDVYVPGTLTENDYANVRVLELHSLPQLALVGTPTQQGVVGKELMVVRNSYSSNWIGPQGSQHVVVDGLLNGWLLQRSHAFSVQYEPAKWLLLGFVASALGAAFAVGLLASLGWRRGQSL